MILILIGCFLVAGPVFAMDQILRTGMWAEASDLLDFDTPSEFVYGAEPYAEYLFGRKSMNKLSGGLYVSLDSPYEFGTEIKRARPSAEGWLDYRFMEEPTSLMETGLWFYGTQDTTSGTYVNSYAYLDWYPINKAQEVTVHPHYLDMLEGVRIGAGIGGGAKVNQLLEDPSVTTDINASLVGILSTGARLGESFWATGYMQMGFLNLAAPSTLDTYTFYSTAEALGAISYVSEKLIAHIALSAYIRANDLVTEDGFLKDPSYTYSYRASGEVGYFFLDNFNVYTGAELTGTRGSLLDNCLGYIGAQYYLL